jgi:hypothetical protein
VHAKADTTSGGVDQAFLWDSPGNDVFFGWPTSARLRDNGGTFNNRAVSFEEVFAYSVDGNDTAKLYHQAGTQDALQVWPHQASFGGDGFYLKPKSFPKVEAYSETADNDGARFYNSSGLDVFKATPDEALMTYGDGETLKATATGFRRVAVESDPQGQENDEAYLYDSAGNDLFHGTADYGLMDFDGDDFYIKAWWFAVGEAHAEDREDYDTAILDPDTIWEKFGHWEN